MDDNSVFIIAELSANHVGKLDVAIETIKEAKKAGADAIKLQTFTASTITIDCNKEDFIIKGGTIWDKKKLFDLYQEASLPWEWHKELFQVAQNEGLVCFSSPFDFSAVDFLEKLDCPIYKIASFEITDIPLIEYTAKKGKPIIISTGIADYEDIKLAIETCRNVGNNNITILKCTSAYPAPIEEANLLMMGKIKNDFNVKVGLSDHTKGITLPVVAVALGAKVIEKHFILDKSLGGPDSLFSLNKSEFKQMVDSVREAEASLGQIKYELSEKQINSKQFSRSIYVVKNINKGERFTNENIKSIRPGFGLHPKFLPQVIGKLSKFDLNIGDRFKLEYLQDE